MGLIGLSARTRVAVIGYEYRDPSMFAFSARCRTCASPSSTPTRPAESTPRGTSLPWSPLAPPWMKSTVRESVCAHLSLGDRPAWSAPRRSRTVDGLVATLSTLARIRQSTTGFVATDRTRFDLLGRHPLGRRAGTAHRRLGYQRPRCGSRASTPSTSGALSQCAQRPNPRPLRRRSALCSATSPHSSPTNPYLARSHISTAAKAGNNIRQVIRRGRRACAGKEAA